MSFSTRTDLLGSRIYLKREGSEGLSRFTYNRASGFFKTYRQIRERFSWKGLKDDVLKHIRECTTCQQNKSEQTHPTGLLQPLPIPEQKWESISMDFITGLPRVQGRDCIFVVVDRLTKFAHFFAIPMDYKAIQVAELFFRRFSDCTVYPGR
jgi:hypothetical protein